ncbi:MAG: hypothetical protein HGA44_13765, partial [Cellulomonadaceae bacterium]|nr:hypothetical protein [Cellulomonadaceae bacterium]
MRSVAEHLAAVLAAAHPVAPLDVVLADADGCILAEDVTAPADVPSWTVAGCDGYAVRSADVGPSGPGPAPEVALPVVADAPVTSSAPIRLVVGTAVLVAAGAPLPIGADADHAIIVGRDEESLAASLSLNKIALDESADYTKFTVDTSHLFGFPTTLDASARRLLLDLFQRRSFEMPNILFGQENLVFSFDEEE